MPFFERKKERSGLGGEQKEEMRKYQFKVGLLESRKLVFGSIRREISFQDS